VLLLYHRKALEASRWFCSCLNKCIFWGRVGGYLHAVMGALGNPQFQGVILFNKNKRKLPLTRWSRKALETNFLVHFGGLGLGFIPLYPWSLAFKKNKIGVLFVCVVVSTSSFWSCKSGYHHLNFYFFCFLFWCWVLDFRVGECGCLGGGKGGGGVCFVFCISMGILK